MSALTLPDGVRRVGERGPRWADWVAGLPRRTTALLDGWELKVDGEALHGYCSLVLPVCTAAGERAVLKVAFPDDESEHEHLALQHWHGQGAVRLLRADPGRRALLLERLLPQDLTGLRDIEACEVVAGLYARLHRPAMPQLRLLTAYVERWSDDLARLPRSAPVPRRLVEQALSLGRALVDDGASIGTLIHGDLHYENVLAADREAWLAIDPKPVSGDPHYEVAPLLWNRWDELADPGVRHSVRAGVRRRFHATVDAAGLDEQRARDWVVVRMVHNAMWAIQDQVEHSQRLDEDYLTMCVAIAKAVQD